MFCPGAELPPPPPPPPPGFFEVEEFGDDAAELVEDEPVVVEVSECDGGLAIATYGIAVVATIPAPMPKATANAPTRPMYFAFPIVMLPG
jgi:hypothetical protein